MNPTENISVAPSGRLEAAVIEDSFEADRVNTARLIIKNPFDVTVHILQILPPKASSLTELESERAFGEDKDGKTSKATKISGTWPKSFFSTVRNMFGFGSSEIRFGGIAVSSPKRIEIVAKENSIITVDQPLPKFDRLAIVADPGSTITIAGQPVDELKASDKFESVRIAPHCEVVQYFSFKMNHWLMFKPTKVSISVQIKYRVNSEERDQVVSASLEVKPPLVSMIIGSLTGAILGTLAKIYTQSIYLDVKGWFVILFSGIVMSLIATILLSRKTGAQGFITIEDFLAPLLSEFC
jgi:hypothetical protein